MIKPHSPRCKKCKCIGTLDEEFDAYYCVKCYEWIEKKCKDPKCKFCKNRPEKPPKSNGKGK
jgi:hypothetical protein